MSPPSQSPTSPPTVIEPPLPKQADAEITQARSKSEHPVTPWAQALGLLVLATILDEVTGPTISAAAFYIFPIALAGWRIGGKFAGLMAAAAIVLNAMTIWMDSNPHGFTRDLLISQALQAVIYGAVAFLSVRLRHGYHTLNEQHWELRTQNERVEGLRRQMTDEMKTARALQELLFVPPPPRPTVDMGIFMAAARILGGDIVDVSYSGNRLAIVVADVSGKGTPAALATAVLLGLLEDSPARYESPARTLEFLNRRLTDRLPDNMFVTVLYVLLDIESGEMIWSTAGHESPLILHTPPEGSLLHEIQDPGKTGNRGMALAIMNDVAYRDNRAVLAPDDVLFCYTDGLSDLRLPSGDRLGTERLHTLLAEYAYLPAADITAAMVRKATGKSKEQLSSGVIDDDMSIIAIRRLPPKA